LGQALPVPRARRLPDSAVGTEGARRDSLDNADKAEHLIARILLALAHLADGPAPRCF
jgi:hypothetical protein